MIPPATAEPVTTLVQLVLPDYVSPRLRTLLDVHRRVMSRRWQLMRRSPDGTVHHLADGPLVRVRTEKLTPVPSAERTTR